MCQKAKPKKIGFPFTLGRHLSGWFSFALSTRLLVAVVFLGIFLSPLWISREMKTFAFAGLDRALIFNVLGCLLL